MGMLVQQIIRARIELPAGLSPESVALIKALLQPDASQRLGAAPRGAAAVKEAPFFASVDWMQLFLRQVRIRNARPRVCVRSCPCPCCAHACARDGVAVMRHARAHEDAHAHARAHDDADGRCPHPSGHRTTRSLGRRCASASRTRRRASARAAHHSPLAVHSVPGASLSAPAPLSALHRVRAACAVRAASRLPLGRRQARRGRRAAAARVHSVGGHGAALSQD